MAVVTALYDLYKWQKINYPKEKKTVGKKVGRSFTISFLVIYIIVSKTISTEQ